MNPQGQYIFPNGILASLRKSAVQEAANVLRANGMTVLWFRHAYKDMSPLWG